MNGIRVHWGCGRALMVGAATLVLATLLAPTSSAQTPTVRNPRRLAAGPTGQILVTERSLGSIVAVDQDTLAPVWSFTLPDEELPFGLASWNRLVFVGNTSTRNVGVYRMLGSARQNMRLRFEYNLGHTPAGETGTIENPISIAIDRKAQLVFVLDGRQKRIKIFDRRGFFVAAFAPVDSAAELMSPVSLAVDPARQEVIVGDYGDPSGFFRARRPARLLIYDYQGRLQFQIDGNGDTDASTRFARVQGVAIDSEGHLFVTDPLAGRILVLDRLTGALVTEIGTAGHEPGQLALPLDVHLDEKTGDLFVSNNRGARRIEAFRGAGVHE